MVASLCGGVKIGSFWAATKIRKYPNLGSLGSDVELLPLHFCTVVCVNLIGYAFGSAIKHW
jgi:hypothetical protein